MVVEVTKKKGWSTANCAAAGAMAALSSGKDEHMPKMLIPREKLS